MKMKWIQKLRQIDIGISVIALVLLIAVTFAGVIFRYVFSKPFSWQEEVQLALIIWVIFFGARYAFETFSHVAIDMLYELFPAKEQKVLTVFPAVVNSPDLRPDGIRNPPSHNATCYQPRVPSLSPPLLFRHPCRTFPFRGRRRGSPAAGRPLQTGQVWRPLSLR